jgi:transposase InsO family protein
MKWSAITYNGNLQDFINNMRSALRDIESVEIVIPPTIISYVKLGKLMKAKELDQLVNKIALLEDSVKTPYLVLDALQTYYTHNMNKTMGIPQTSLATALVSSSGPVSSQFSSKVIPLCGHRQHNPLVRNHPKSKCFHKYPHLKTEVRPPKNASASYAQATALAMITSSVPDSYFILDSAATHHMLRDRGLFVEFVPRSTEIKTGNPLAPLFAKGHGTAVILVNGKNMTLSNCLYVPSISQQLLSLVQILNDSLCITQNGHSFSLGNHSGPLMTGIICDNLLLVKTTPSSPKALVSIAAKKDMGATLWHNCLGHPGNQALKHLHLPTPGDEPCKVCLCSKMTLLSFPGHFAPAPSPLFRLHMDLVGPITPASVSGFKYFLTVVDQFSSFKLIRFLKAKSDAITTVKELLNLVENTHNAKVKEIVSDRGGEFLNHTFAEMVLARGITHTLSPPYTPQHNGFAERANWTILDKACCLMTSSNLPRSYWAEAVNTAVFLSNLLPTASCSNQSPYQLWTNSPPPLRRLKTFGCLAFFAVRKEHWSWKLAKTGEMGIFVGYENDGTTFRIVCLSDHNLVSTRHAIFSEFEFPVLSGSTIPCSPDFFLEEDEDGNTFYECNSDPVPPIPMDVPAVEPLASPGNQSLDFSTPPELLPEIVAHHPPQEISGDISTANIVNHPRCHRAMVVTVDMDAPSFYHQAIQGPEATKWRAAINKELSATNNLSVWLVVDLTPGIKTIGTTWVFQKKPGSSSPSVEFKARLCAQGFSQTYGIDFLKTFAPTGRLNSLRALISHAAANDLQFKQLDVKTAFLNANLDEDVHLSIPQGVPLDHKKFCLKLKKAIYGLKQAPLAWYNRLSTWLKSVGFDVSLCDPCVFFWLSPSSVWLFIHVDDIAVFGKDVSQFKAEIKSEFDMKDLGTADLLLGVKIHHEPDAIILSQRHYVAHYSVPNAIILSQRHSPRPLRHEDLSPDCHPSCAQQST